jgi:hypothetical protein
MTRHALAAHFPVSGCFGVSSLRTEDGVRRLEPRNLAQPLTWLVQALQAQDQGRLQRLFASPHASQPLLERSVACFEHRYPDAPAVTDQRRQLQDMRHRRRRRRSLLGAVCATLLVLGLWSYDALGYQRAAQFEAEHASDPVATLEKWQRFETWHPTRYLFAAQDTVTAQEHRLTLTEHARQFQRDRQLAELRSRALDPDADPEAAWTHFCELKTTYPELGQSEEWAGLRQRLHSRRQMQLERRAQQTLDRLTRAEHEGTDLTVLVAQADQFLRDFAECKLEADVRQRRTAYGRRLEEREIEVARSYSARQPFNFQTRRELYQRYLDRHPTGLFAGEAAAALAQIEQDWDKQDFRELRDYYLAHAGASAEIVARARAYLAVHPQGHFTAAAADLLRWTERVTVSGEYRVVLHSGDFDHKIAHFFSRGPDLSVELEVAGVRYGPSNIVLRRYDPEWNYEFPRRIRWKLGDRVRIRVYDHNYWKRLVMDLISNEDDPLAMNLLSGEVWCGTNHLTFESDFAMPVLPSIE